MPLDHGRGMRIAGQHPHHIIQILEILRLDHRGVVVELDINLEQHQVITRIQGIGLVLDDLMPVCDSAFVRVAVQRIGLVFLDLVTVGKAVEIRVRVQRIGLVHFDFIVVCQPVAVRVRLEGIRAQLGLFLVGQAIPVRIFGQISQSARAFATKT